MNFSSPTPTPRIGEAIHQYRWIIGGFILLVVSAVVFGILSNPSDRNPLSIHNPGPNGAMALAEVLQQKGVKVHDIYTPRDAEQLGEKDLLVVTGLADLTDKHLSALMKSPSTAILFLGTFAQNNRLEPYASPQPDSTPDGVAPHCKLDGAYQAGPLHGSRGSLKPLRNPIYACYPVSPGKYAYLQFERPGGLKVSFLADGHVAENREITYGSNAAFLLNLMLPATNIGWIVGATFQLSADNRNGDGATEIIPPALTHALILFFAAFFVLALARGRRLGRIVPESMLVAVHGAETVYGRARMYRNSRAFETASRHARAYTAQRLAKIVHLPVTATGQELCQRLANYADLPLTQVSQTLLGEPPHNGNDLVSLLNDLESLVENTKGKGHK